MLFCHTSRRHRRAILTAVGGLALVVLFVLQPTGSGGAALAATLITPYPAMTVQAGQTVDIDLSLTHTVSQRFDLSVRGVPQGWEATIMGGGRPVQAVMTDPEHPSSLELEVTIPADAEEGASTITFIARSAETSISIPITLTVSRVEGGATTLEADFTSLRGPATARYTFSLTLENETLESQTYNISASGPEHWGLSLRPTGAAQETPTVTVDAERSQALTLEVTPAPNPEIGSYNLSVTAVGGGETVSIPLQIEITGTYELTVTTPDGNLNAEVRADSATDVQFVVHNNGTGPLQSVELRATAPVNWEVTFEPRVIPILQADERQTVNAVFRPAEDAIPGDYVVTVNATADQATARSDIRVTVETSTLWGVIGVLIAIAAIAILGFVFRRYGRR